MITKMSFDKNAQWTESTFKEVLDIERGSSPRPIGKYLCDSDDGLNWIKIGDAPINGNRITSVKEKILTTGLNQTRMVHKGDLILSNSMSFGRPYILEVDGCIHDGWLVIRNINNIFNLEFLVYLLASDRIKKQYKKLAGSGVVSNLNKDLVSEVILKYPPIKEQQKIAEFLTALDEKIRIEEQRLRIFKKQASAVISGIFNRNSDLNEVTGKFNTHHLGSLVEEVKLLNKNKECDLVITNSAEFGIVPQKDFFDRNIAQEVNVDKYTIVENGDFVYNPRISKTAPAGPINRSHLNQGVVSPLYTVFRVNSDLVIGDYLECYFASGRWVAYAKSVANYGARHDRMNITNDDFFNMPIPVPDLKDQANISGLYKTLNLKSKLQESKLSCLIKLKKAFMQRMFV